MKNEKRRLLHQQGRRHEKDLRGFLNLGGLDRELIRSLRLLSLGASQHIANPR